MTKKRVYVRKAYIDLFKIICDQFDFLETNHDFAVRITGTPGVGKTFFLGYVLHRLMELRKFTVVAKVKRRAIIFDHESGTCKEIFDNVDHYLKEGIIFLVDPDSSYTPAQTEAITVLFVPPTKVRVGDFSTRNLFSYYMPPWMEEELRDCVAELYSDQLCRFDAQFQKWGGSIRDVACYSNSAEQFRELALDKVLRDKSLIDIVNQVSSDEFQKSELISHQWIVHRIPEEENDYVNYSCDFPSQYIANKVMCRMRELKLDWKLVTDMCLLGRLYESEVLESLFRASHQQYLQQEAQKITRGRRASVAIPAVKQQHIYSSRAIFEQHESGTLYIPIERNRPGSDLMMPPWIFQITMAKAHSAKKLDKIFTQFPNVDEWKICFVIPLCIGDEFSAPNLAKYPKIKEKYKLTFDFELD